MRNHSRRGCHGDYSRISRWSCYQPHVPNALDLADFLPKRKESRPLPGCPSVNCPTKHITICSDNQSLLRATHHIRQRLDNRKGLTILIWVPDHKDMHGNEPANEVAKADAGMADTPLRLTLFANAGALIRRTITDPPTNRFRTAMGYENFSWSAYRKTPENGLMSPS